MLFYFLYIYRNIEYMIIDIYLIYVFNCADMLQFPFGLIDTIYIYFTTQEALLEEEKYCNAYIPPGGMLMPLS